jgi:hypothetical protein
LSLRIFEEPQAIAESPEQAHVSIGARIIFSFWAMLVVVLPALTAAYAAFRVINTFRNMTNAEEAGRDYIQGNLHAANLPLIIALAVSALLSLGMALILTVNSKRRLAGVGLPFSVGVPILALIPGLLLWFAESTVVALLDNRLTGASVEDTALTVSWLLAFSMVSGGFVLFFSFVCSVVSLLIPPRRRGDPLSAPRAFVWLVSGVLFLMSAGLFFILV